MKWIERLKYLFSHRSRKKTHTYSHTQFNDKQEINVYFILLMNF